MLRGFRTGDQDAFAGLMKRHGRMVSGVVRSVLGDSGATEDVVQASFLTLARKSASLEGADSVAGWLCRVAVCLARDERRKDIRRAAREKESDMTLDGSAQTSALPEGALSALYEELSNLTEKYRQPVILHHLEGMSYVEAASVCGCSETAFSVRLTRAREQLRKRLAGRGVALGAAGLLAGLGQGAQAVELPAALISTTCKVAGGISAGSAIAEGLVSAKVLTLTDGAMKMLFWVQIKTAVAVCLVVAGIGAGVVGVTYSSRPLPQIADKQPERNDVAAATPGGTAGKPEEDKAVSKDASFLFRSSFENGLADWNLYTRTGAGGRVIAVEGKCPDICVVKADRGGKPVSAVELTGGSGRSAGMQRTVQVKALPDFYSLSYAYTYEGPQRHAMEGIYIGPERKFKQMARPAGEWNQVRWECRRRSDGPGRATLDAILFFNGEQIELTSYDGSSGVIDIVLEAVDGKFLFADVVVTEGKAVYGEMLEQL